MLALIAPSKTQTLDALEISTHSQPIFHKKTHELIEYLKTYSIAELCKLMKMSQKLGEQNHQRFHDFITPFNQNNAKQAILAFQGDVYSGIEVANYSENDFTFSQNHLRILSGLYGALRPLDLIQPYRLEMGLKWQTIHWKSLYNFWAEDLTKYLNETCAKNGTDTILNLASNEYFKVINKKTLQPDVITPVFKEKTEKGLKIVAIYAKKARGQMINHIICERITDVEKLRSYQKEGYRFSTEESTPTSFVYIRESTKK